MAISSLEGAVIEYEDRYRLYEQFAHKLRDLVPALLQAENIDFHIAEARAKTVKSFRDKATRSGKNYADPLNEITDLCGCRIIVFYADDVQRAADIIRKEFNVIEEETSHQQDALDSDRFGYLSLHYVFELKSNRSALAEWRAYAGLKTEIQIRTVIQHAWSAVSHALQYKQETSVPSKLQRRLYRIAGLFELADEEFVDLRDQRSKLHKGIETALHAGATEIPLSVTSIKEVVRSWKHISQVRSMASDAGLGVRRSAEAEDGTETITDTYDLAQLVGLKTVGDLLSVIDLPQKDYFEEIVAKIPDGKEWKLSDDFLLFFVLAAKFRSKLTKQFLIDHDWAEEFADRLL